MNNKNKENLNILNRGETKYPANPAEAQLETFKNPSPKNSYTIEFKTEEFTSLCPVTEQPDFAAITIKYIPEKKCIESKSLKLYLFSYRNYKGFAEEIINKIKEDVAEVCDPRKVEVTGNFKARGGITINVDTVYIKEKGENK
ncbi:MAG: preQ(1) synthase [Elusimicrobiota bacterium]